jgi:uncharacterized membrane protein (DUF2068 family)
MSKRPPGLLVVIVYKAFTAALFAVTSIAILLTLKNYEGLQQLSESLFLAGKQGVIAWIVQTLLNINPKTLHFGGIVAAVYAGVTCIETIGLWYQKNWARWLVIGVVAISIPPEIFELSEGFSPLKLIAFLLNLAILIYLLLKFPKKVRLTE